MSCNKCDNKLQKKFNNLQNEFNQLKEREYQSSYIIENQKQRIESLGKALTLYEKENKVFRELIRLWV